MLFWWVLTRLKINKLLCLTNEGPGSNHHTVRACNRLLRYYFEPLMRRQKNSIIRKQYNDFLEIFFSCLRLKKGMTEHNHEVSGKHDHAKNVGHRLFKLNVKLLALLGLFSKKKTKKKQTKRKTGQVVLKNIIIIYLHLNIRPKCIS